MSPDECYLVFYLIAKHHNVTMWPFHDLTVEVQRQRFFKMPLAFLACFYCTGRSQWLLEYSFSCCCQRRRASLWRRLTRSCAQRGTTWPRRLRPWQGRPSHVVHSPHPPPPLCPHPAGFTTVKNAAASSAGGRRHRSTRGCSVRPTAGRRTRYDCSHSLHCACTAILRHSSTEACVCTPGSQITPTTKSCDQY